MTDDLANLTVTRVGDSVVARLVGEVDLSNAAQLGEQMRDLLRGHTTMTLDLTGLDYFDSAGLALVHDLARQAKTEGRELKLVAAEHSNARRVLLLTRIDEIIAVETSLPA